MANVPWSQCETTRNQVVRITYSTVHLQYFAGRAAGRGAPYAAMLPALLTAGVQSEELLVAVDAGDRGRVESLIEKGVRHRRVCRSRCIGTTRLLLPPWQVWTRLPATPPVAAQRFTLLRAPATASCWRFCSPALPWSLGSTLLMQRGGPPCTTPRSAASWAR